MITLLWAQTKNGIIGNKGNLPWKIPEEMNHFVNYTTKKIVLMGRKTWDSLSKKPLPNRKNIVLTRDKLEEYPDVEVINNLDPLLEKYKGANSPELVIIGGNSVFDPAVNVADKLIISMIKKDYPGDIYAPKWQHDDFNLIDEKMFLEFSIQTFVRKTSIK